MGDSDRGCLDKAFMGLSYPQLHKGRQRDRSGADAGSPQGTSTGVKGSLDVKQLLLGQQCEVE